MSSLRYIRFIYKLLAPIYNFFEKPYTTLRKRAIDTMNLSPGQTVLDIACGTGLNFKFLLKKIGPKGIIIGVDYSKDMLRMAQKEKLRLRAKNIELIRMNINEFEPKEEFDGIICSFGFTLVPDYVRVMKKALSWLKKGRYFVIVDQQYVSGKFSKLYNLLFLAPLYRFSGANGNRKPWKFLQRYTEDFYWDGPDKASYVAFGRKK